MRELLCSAADCNLSDGLELKSCSHSSSPIFSRTHCAGTKLKSAADRQLKSEPVVDPKAKAKGGAGSAVPAPLSMINIAQMAAERSKQLKKVSAAAGGGGGGAAGRDVKPEEWR